MRFLAWLFVLLAACSSAQEPDSRTTTAPEAVLADPDAVAYLDDTGNIALVGRDGVTSRLTDDASDQTIYQQPTWSPGGAHLAWTAIIDTGDGPRSEVHLVGPGSHEIIPVPKPPFYYSWSPDGSLLAALASGPRSLDLWIVDAREGEAEVLAEGQPFYFAWSPDSKRILTHVGNERLSVLTLDGESELISSSSAGYQAPGWSRGGELAYVVDRDASVAGSAVNAQADPQRQLVIADEESRTLRVLDSFSGFASMSFSPDGSRLAYSITQDPSQVPSNLGPLLVTDLGGSSLRIEAGPVVLYQWSPDSQKLLYAVFSDTELRWKVHTGGTSTDYGPFLPTSRYVAENLPFWDQYALSASLWAPDGSAFAYAAREGEQDLIFIQPLSDSSPRQVAAGSVAFWSP